MPKDIVGMRAWIMGLAVDCPFSNPLPTCIFEQFRNIPYEEAHKLIYTA